MKRLCDEYPFAPRELKTMKDKMLSWASRFGIFLCLDSNDYEDDHGSYECLAGTGGTGCEKWDPETGDWQFGHLCYDYKNEIEPSLHTRHAASTGFKPLHFFVPDIVCYIARNKHVLVIESLYEKPDAVFEAISGQLIPVFVPLPPVRFTQRIGRMDYLKKIAALRSHIYEGDCYEINFCNEAFADHAVIDPLHAYRALNAISPAPFSAFYRSGDSYLMCASPERFLTRHAQKIISQPIKGTAKRSKDKAEDNGLKAALLASEKERAENVMIVDLVRNDLAKSCVTGSIQVDELFGLYTFPQVHQMISTVSGLLRDDCTLKDAVLNAFPMGSMTGAPKYRVMQLIDDYEAARRELFAGTVGYISPDGNADFNVVIRSLFYNAATQRLSYQTGGAITWDSTPEAEWEEMRLKAEGMERIFS